MTDAAVKTALAALAKVHEATSPPDVDQRVAAYWWGVPDDDIAWCLSMCSKIAEHRVASSLYIASVAEDLGHKRDIKDWAYITAAELAAKPAGRIRARASVEGYKPTWGHQAARDGVFLALWGHMAEYVPGVNFRARHYGCGNQAYQRIRDGVFDRARELVTLFRDDMNQALSGRHSRNFTDRWEAATGTYVFNWDGNMA